MMTAFEEYELAKSRTLEFLELRSAGGQPTRIYMSALHHWEQCVAGAWQAVAAWMKMTSSQAFAPGDASNEAKLNHIYNRSKHTDKAITAFADQMPERGPLAVWITGEGLRSAEQLLYWAELVEVLGELAQAADLLQDPQSISDHKDPTSAT